MTEVADRPLPDEGASRDRGAQQDQTASAGQATEGSEEAADRRRSRQPGQTLSRLTLGSMLLGLEALDERLADVESLETEIDGPARTVEDILIPMSEWEETIGESPSQSARYLAIGMMADARNQVRRSGWFFNRMSGAIYGLFNAVFSPFFDRGPLKPVGKGIGRLEKRGQRQVDRWMAMGKTEDSRSRALAQTTIDQFVHTSMDELVDNPRVQVFIQEIVQAQSQGFVDEAIEEVRERTITGDLVMESKVRRLLRRTPRESLPRPDFDPLLVSQKRRLPASIVRQSSLGSYAGFTSRLLAFVLDVAVIAAFLGISTWFITATVSLLGLEQFFESVLSADNFVALLGTLLISMYGALVVLAYALVSWTLTGQSIGMMLIGLRVVTIKGERVSFWRAILRIVGYVISAAALFLGFVWILGDNRRQGWHDKLAGTLVVYTWPARPDEQFLVGHY